MTIHDERYDLMIENEIADIISCVIYGTYPMGKKQNKIAFGWFNCSGSQLIWWQANLFEFELNGN